MINDLPSRGRASFARQAEEALENAVTILSEKIPGRQPDTELASVWALVGQGWAMLAALPEESRDSGQRS